MLFSIPRGRKNSPPVALYARWPLRTSSFSTATPFRDWFAEYVIIWPDSRCARSCSGCPLHSICSMHGSCSLYVWYRVWIGFWRNQASAFKTMSCAYLVNRLGTTWFGVTRRSASTFSFPTVSINTSTTSPMRKISSL